MSRALSMTLAVAALLSVSCSSDDGNGDADTDPTAATEASTGSSTMSTMSTVTGTTTSTTTATTQTDTSTTGSTTEPATTTTGSTDATQTTGTADGSSSGEPVGERVLFAVGYGGMRVRSLDDGLTWQDYTQLVDSGGDDMELLRGCAWGNGRFVAGGWRIFSSTDAVTWEEHDNPTGQWFGAVAFGNDLFVGVGGGGYCARSSDGIAWESCTDVTDDGAFTHVRSTLFHDGLFYTADANGDVRSSPDGDVWTFEQNLGTPWIAVDGDAIVAREENAPAEFPDLRLRGTIERADPGSERFTRVFDAQNNNNVFQANRFAFCEGFLEP